MLNCQPGGLGVGDMRFNGMTALHGAVIYNQPSIVQFLIDKARSWTSLMVSSGLYIANNRKDFPREGELLKKALTVPGLPVK